MLQSWSFSSKTVEIRGRFTLLLKATLKSLQMMCLNESLGLQYLLHGRLNWDFLCFAKCNFSKFMHWTMQKNHFSYGKFVFFIEFSQNEIYGLRKEIWWSTNICKDPNLYFGGNLMDSFILFVSNSEAYIW